MCFDKLLGGGADPKQPAAPVSTVRQTPEATVKTTSDTINNTTGVSVPRSKKAAQRGVPGLNL